MKIALELPTPRAAITTTPPRAARLRTEQRLISQPNLMDLERQLILQELLEHRRPEQGHRDRVQGLTGQLKKFQRTMFRLQQQLHDATSLAERFVHLLSWTHPRKTALVVAGMLCGISMLLLFPNRLVVAAGVSYMYLDGLMMSLDKTEKSGQKTVAKSDIQMLNFLRSIPNKVELRNVFNLRRHFFELDQSTQHARAHRRHPLAAGQVAGHRLHKRAARGRRSQCCARRRDAANAVRRHRRPKAAAVARRG